MLKVNLILGLDKSFENLILLLDKGFEKQVGVVPVSPRLQEGVGALQGSKN